MPNKDFINKNAMSPTARILLKTQAIPLSVRRKSLTSALFSFLEVNHPFTLRFRRVELKPLLTSLW